MSKAVLLQTPDTASGDTDKGIYHILMSIPSTQLYFAMLLGKKHRKLLKMAIKCYLHLLLYPMKCQSLRYI